MRNIAIVLMLVVGVVIFPIHKVTAGGPSGDANGDGKADLVDFSIWKIEYMATNGMPVTSFDYSGPKKADFNQDGRVDLADFVVWKNNY